MDEEFEGLKPAFAPKALHNWNIEDLEAYIKRLEEEIQRVQSALETKTAVADAAKGLFK